MDGKSEIRRRMGALRRGVGEAARGAYSGAVCARILARADVRSAIAAGKPFAVYLATSREIDLAPLICRLWAEGCAVYAPAWDGESYVLRRHAPGVAPVAGPMGVLEPPPGGDEADPSVPGVWIVPGLAFTVDGRRLGYGGGWYDRLLARASASAKALGVAYPFQVVEDLPSEGHDVALSGVVVA